MTKMKKSVLAAVLLLAGCAATPEPSAEQHRYSNLTYDSGFDTIYSYTEFGTDDALMEANFNTGTQLFSKCNDLFDIYHTYEGINNLKTINDKAGIEPVKADPVIIDMLKEAEEFYELTDGAFDITIGSLLHVWHTYREEGITANSENRPGAVPSLEELQQAAEHCGWSHVHIDEENSSVYLDDPDMSLDVGGIAKGYAAELIAQSIEDNVSGYANINAGRNIRTIHQKTNGTDWRVGIVEPDGENSLLIITMPDSCSFVTSGDYERFYTDENGTRYHHIVDPSALYPADLYRSVTIVTRDSGAADCLSTALFCLSIEEGKEVLKAYSEKSGEAAEAVWVMMPEKKQEAEGRIQKDYYVSYTEGLKESIVWQ